MWWCCAQRSSVWSDDRAGSRNADLDRRRRDRSPSWIYGSERDGADGTQRESIFRSRVRVSWAPRRSDQDVVVGRRWSLSFCKKNRARKIHVATSDERNGGTDSRTVIHVARGNRLETSGTQLRSANGGVKEK